MRKSWLVAVSIVLVALLLGTAGCVPYTPSKEGVAPALQQPTGITVTGQGKVKVKPDMAVLNLGVEAEAEKITEAYAQANEAMNKVMEALKAKGIAEEDIQTRYFSIRQERRPVEKLKAVPPPSSPKEGELKVIEREKEMEVVFKVSNMVTAKVRKIEDVSNIVGAAVEAGGKFIRVQGLNFTVEDTEIYQKEARNKAIANAKEKAGQIAKQAGVTLGEPIYISEGYMPYPRGGMAPAAVPAPAPPTIYPGMEEIRVSVSITFSIE